MTNAKRIYAKERSYLSKADVMGVRPAKRAGLPGATFVVLLLILLAVVPLVNALPGHQSPRHADGAAPAPGRDAGEWDVKLFLRSNGTGGTPYLGTVAGTTASPRQLPVELALQHSFNSSVAVIGKDMSTSSKKGMWLWAKITGVPLGNNIKIEILENDIVIANGTMPIGTTTGVQRWDVPFVSDESGHTFLAGSTLKVRISASVALTTIQLNTQDCYIWMPMTTPPLEVGMGTYNAPGKATTEFAPNWPDSIRRIRVEGDIGSLFGPGDIHNVIVTIRNPSGGIAFNSTAQLSDTHYIANWSYSRSDAVPGNYNVTVSAFDQQGHEYPASMMVTMLRYAVYISSPQQDANDIVVGVASPPRGGSEEKDAVYSLLILNSGYSATSATVRVSSDPPPGWTATLSTGSTQSINPGATANITLTVSPNSDVEFGNRAVIYVEARADADTGTPKASWTIQTVTNATMSRNLDFSLSGPSETWVDVGQTATYQMVAKNKGVLDMNVTFTPSGTPLGWSALLDVTQFHLDTGSNSEKAVTLRVTAPSEEVANLSRVAQLTVTAQVMEDATLQKQVTTVTRLITILGLTMDKAVQTSDPAVLGGKVDFRATISNLDPQNSHPLHIAVAQPAEWPANSVSFSPRDTLLSPNTTTTIIISVTPPSSAVANTDSGYTLLVTVTPTDQPTRSNATNIVVKVKPSYALTMDISQTGVDASPGQKVTVTITIKNLGNSNTVVTLVATGVPSDWKVKLEDVSAPNLYSVSLAPAGQIGSMQTVNLTIQPSKTSRDNNQVKVTVTAGSAAPDKTVSVRVTVKKNQLDKLVDSLTDSMLILVLCVLVLIVFAVVLRRSARTA